MSVYLRQYGCLCTDGTQCYNNNISVRQPRSLVWDPLLSCLLLNSPLHSTTNPCGISVNAADHREASRKSPFGSDHAKRKVAQGTTIILYARGSITKLYCIVRLELERAELEGRSVTCEG